MADSILYELEDHVATVTMNRPAVMNALDPDAMVQLRQAWVRARDDDDVRVVILTGAGDKAFCAGADINKTPPGVGSPARGCFSNSDEACIKEGAYVRVLNPYRLDLWKPVVAAINGHAVGGGLELALACDLRVASENATFGLPEVKLASIPALGGIQQLVRAMPRAIAMKMLLTGARIKAEEALRYGLVSDVVPPSQLRDYARNLAREIAANGPLALQAVKMLVRCGMNIPFNEAVSLEFLMWSLLRDSEDRTEGRRAFAENREPRFQGR